MQGTEYMVPNNIKKAEEGAKSFISEFKDFIKRGNVVDLAVAVVMGSSFSAIVNSLVNDIIMPFVGIIIGGINFSELSFTIKDSTVFYGKFIQAIINFLIIAMCIFIIVKIMNRFIAKKEEKKEEIKEEPPKKEEVVLLEEIRDLLKK